MPPRILLHHSESSQAGLQAGFTLIEVMIVVVIIAILSGFAINSFYQQAYRQTVQGEAKQVVQFLNMANMYVKKTGQVASLKINATGLSLQSEASCGGSVIRDNKFAEGIELVSMDSRSLTGLPTGMTASSGVPGFLGNWNSCIELDVQVGNAIEDNGGLVLGNSRLPQGEEFNVAIVKAASHINFRKYVSIASGDWDYRK